MSRVPSPSTSTSAGEASQFSSQLAGRVARSAGAWTGPDEPSGAALHDGAFGSVGSPSPRSTLASLSAPVAELPDGAPPAPPSEPSPSSLPQASGQPAASAQAGAA